MLKREALLFNEDIVQFLEHTNDYSESQVEAFVKSVYNASQERIVKGKRLVEQDDYPKEAVLEEIIDKLYK